MFDKSVKVWMRESVWKCKRTVKLTLAQNMPTFAPKARRSAFIRTRTAHARPSSLKKIFTFSSVLFNLFLWLNLILTSGAVLHLHLGWFYLINMGFGSKKKNFRLLHCTQRFILLALSGALVFCFLITFWKTNTVVEFSSIIWNCSGWEYGNLTREDTRGNIEECRFKQWCVVNSG